MRPSAMALAAWMIVAVALASAPSPEERLAALDLRLQTAPEAEQAELFNSISALVVRRDGARALDQSRQALAIAEKHADLPAQAEAHKGLGLALMVLERNAEGLAEADRARALFAELGNRKEMARALGYSAMMLANLGRLREAIARTEEVLVIFRELGDRKGIAAATNNLGVYCGQLGDYQEALRYLLESLASEEALGRTIGIANNLNSIGNIYARLGEHIKARDHYQRALELFEQLGEQDGVSRCLSNIGATHEKLGEDEQALALYERAVTLAQKTGLLAAQANPLNNMGVIHSKHGRLAAALDRFEQAARIHEQLGEKADLAGSHHNIAEVQLKMQRHAEALDSLGKALEIATQTQSREDLAMIYRLLAKAHNELGQHRKAYEYQLLYTSTRDQMLDEERTRAIAELQERYDAEKRRREIEILGRDNELLRKDAEIRRLALVRTRLAAGLAAAAALLAVGTALLLFRRFLYLLTFWKKRTFVGQYRIEEEVSRGGMGIIYRATSLTEPGRTVALKVIRDELIEDPAQRQRFVNEGKLIDAIAHPNIVKVFDRGEHNRRLYIAMEFLEGRTLGQIIEEALRWRQHPDLARCRRILCQLADAITAIHARGIVHRDVTPANIIALGEPGAETVKLLDFGIARLDTATTLTGTGELLGTVGYMAPERIQLGGLSTASDIFSLGVLSYELLTLHRPFAAGEPVEVLRQVLTVQPVAPALLRPDLGGALSDLIMAMLDKDPLRRPGGEEIQRSFASTVGEPA